jgi:hypothetical protein
MKKWEPRFQHIKEPSCREEGCNATVFRGLHVCFHHHMIEVEAKEKERERDRKRAYHQMRQKNWPERQIEGMFQSSNRTCSWCGTSGEGLLNVVKKLPEKMPKNPGSHAETLRVLCNSCLAAGR